MKYHTEQGPWVVYRRTAIGKQPHATSSNAMCEQREWDAMELVKPGFHRLIQGHITDEATAERLARGTSGDGRKSHFLER